MSYFAAAALTLLEAGQCPCTGCRGKLGPPGEYGFRPCPACRCAWTVSDITGRRYPGVVRGNCPSARHPQEVP
jgi:hypothetical protein